MKQLTMNTRFLRQAFLASLLLIAGSLFVQARDFKAMSFNIRMSASAKADGDNCWNNRREAVVGLLRQEAPDFFGVQEALPDQYQYLNKKMRKYGHVGVGRDDGKAKGESMTVYYNKRRFRLLDSGTRWLSETPEEVSFGWDAACRRTVTYVLLHDKKSGRNICYFNTHLDHMGPTARRESILLLCRLIDEMAPAGTPVILGGDMNSTLESSIFKPLEAHQLLSARDIAPESDFGGTYNGWGEADSQIDHFFVRSIDVKKFSVLRGDYGVPYVSDHYPVTILFSLK